MNVIQLEEGVSINWDFWPCPGNGDVNHMAATYQMLKAYIKPGNFVVDIGAFTGDHTVLMGLLAGKTGNVLAFEPNPFSWPWVLRNVENNKDRINAQCHNVAIMPADGEYTFHYSENGFLNGGYVDGLETPMAECKIPHVVPVKIAGKRLEIFLNGFSKINFLKVDAEGYDYRILESIKEIISKDRPTIMAEVFPDLTMGERVEYLNLVDQIGYTVSGKHPDISQFTNDGAYDLILIPK